MNKRYLIWGLLGLALVVLVPTQLKNHGIYLFTYWLVYVIATMGLNLTVGYAGQKSLGHAAFFGIGAYTVAIAMKAGFGFSSPARSDHLPGFCHAGFQHCRLAGDAKRRVANRRHFWHQQHRPARAWRHQF
jgi:ABC-type branched-subunit amino acid transport system permease subunit